MDAGGIYNGEFSVKIAMVQVASPVTESMSARRERVGQMLADTRAADLVVLPELWAPGYFSFDAYPALAEPLDGETVTAGQEWARDLKCFLHLGTVLERSADGRMHNTAVLIDPSGVVIHAYRKVHVFGYESREAELLTPGTSVDVVDTALGQIGSTTCYDLRFPELWRLLIDAGAKTVVTPAAWPAARVEHWRLLTTCRAVEEQVVLIACNAVGVQAGDVELAGHSRVVDPWGEVLAEAGTDESVTLVDVDLSIVDRVRSEFPVLLDRRIGLPATERGAGKHFPETNKVGI